MKKIKVLSVTGIRSEYYILYPIIKTLNDDNNFDISIIVSGANLSDWHGNALQRIEQDGFRISEKIDSLFMTNRETQRVKGVGVLTYALAQTVEREKPDFLMVIGDREESIATALVGNYMNILTVHLGGGDPAYGNADDPIRFAVSKLSHIHCTFAQEYADNLMNIGEEEFRIKFTGNPAYHNIKHTAKLTMEELKKRIGFDIDKDKYIVLIQHPLSSERNSSYEQMSVTLQALSDFAKNNNIKIVGSYPNTDPGSYEILQVIEEYSSLEHIHFYKTLPQTEFVNLLKNSLAIVGNSSMGILESPFYRIPAVNIGNRQKGRLNAGNVDFVDFNISDITKALEKACFNRAYRESIKNLTNPYGDESAPEKIKQFLLSVDRQESKWYTKTKLC